MQFTTQAINMLFNNRILGILTQASVGMYSPLDQPLVATEHFWLALLFSPGGC